MKKLFFTIFFIPLLFLSQQLYFPPVVGNTWDTISPQSLGWCQNKIDSMYAFLDSSNTKSFILLKNGKIVLEKYFGNHTATTQWYWASAGKTLTSFMVGIAQQEGHLNINDTVSNYLGNGWTSCTQAQEEKIKIKNLISMTSGLDDLVPDHYCTLDTCLIYKADAGTRWAYHNGPYTLLDSVINIATGVTLNQYLTQKLKTPTGMTGMFYPSGYNNIFVSNARSMARFGLLILNNGNWNGNQILTDSVYFYQMTHSSQTLNKAYGYLWWLNGSSDFMVPFSQLVFPGQMITDAPQDMISAIGKNGQFINIVPSQNLVWIRMGDAPDSSDVPFLLNNDIWKYINDLTCSSVGLSELNNNSNIDLFPNPAKDFIEVKTSGTPIESIEILNCLGQNISAEKGNIIKTDFLNQGIYYLKIRRGQNIVIKRFIKADY
ncbi:MAG: serine hydrolase [Bacteroidota bacterium]